jgi:hypothetical protein
VGADFPSAPVDRAAVESGEARGRAGEVRLASVAGDTGPTQTGRTDCVLSVPLWVGLVKPSVPAQGFLAAELLKHMEKLVERVDHLSRFV